MTGYTRSDLLLSAERAGFDSVVLKPCLPSALVAEIRAVLRAARGLRRLRAPGTIRGRHARVLKARVSGLAALSFFRASAG